MSDIPTTKRNVDTNANVIFVLAVCLVLAHHRAIQNPQLKNTIKRSVDLIHLKNHITLENIEMDIEKVLVIGMTNTDDDF